MDKLRALISRYSSVVRFAIVGGLSFLIDYGMLLTLYHAAKLPLGLATNIGFLCGLVFNFMLNKFWTFKAPGGVEKSIQQAALYGVLVVINLIFTNIIVLTFQHIGVGPEISKPIATGFIMIFNYVIYKEVIFVQKLGKDSSTAA